MFLREQREPLSPNQLASLRKHASRLGALFGLLIAPKARRATEEKLQESEESFRQLIELAPAPIVVQSEKQIVFVNSSGARLFGAQRPGDLLGMSLWDFVSAEGEPLIEHPIQILEEGESVPRAEFEFVRLDGSHCVAEVSATPIVFNGKPAVQAIFRDITEQKRTENELRERNKELAALNAIAAAVNRSANLDQILYDALDEVLRLRIVPGEMFGMLFLLDRKGRHLQLATARGAPANHPCLLSPPAVGECLCGLAVQQGEMIVSQSVLTDERHTRRWPDMHNHQDICVPLKAQGNVLGVMEIRLPQTYEIGQQNLRLLEAVADQMGVAIENAQLRELRERAVVDERERIANELHDGLSQLLGFVNTKAMAVRLLLKNDELEAADQSLLQLEEAARGLFADVREAILGLKSVGASSAGLAANLRGLVAHFTQLSGLAGDLTISPQAAQLTLKPETEYHLMRIVQEALNNAHKHASPTRTWVTAKVENDRLELRIGDDGTGFELEGELATHLSHFGLRGMSDRAAAIGADLRIESGVGQGTCVSIVLPLAEG